MLIGKSWIWGQFTFRSSVAHHLLQDLSFPIKNYQVLQINCNSLLRLMWVLLSDVWGLVCSHWFSMIYNWCFKPVDSCAYSPPPKKKFLVYNFEFFLWHPDTYWHAVLKGWHDRKQKPFFGPDYCLHLSSEKLEDWILQ